MREDAYRILGVAVGAPQEEIKQAYFRLVRQHTPDNDPEKFQEICRAYDMLKETEEENNGKETVKLEIPADPLGKKMMEQIEESYRHGNFDLVIDTAEEAIRYFGNCSGYVFYLALAQRAEGYTGKSVRNFEFLVLHHPEEMRFHRELALSLRERGFWKKALDAFEKAYRMGCRDEEFLLMFSMCCDERHRSTRSVQILEELLSGAGRKVERQPLNYLEVYVSLLFAGCCVSDEKFRQAGAQFAQFISQAGAALETGAEEISYALLTLSSLSLAIGDSSMEMRRINARIRASWTSMREILNQILKTARQALPEKKPLWEQTQEKIDLMFLMRDPETSLILKRVAGASADEAGMEKDPMYERFVRLDSKLCILEEWPGNREELDKFRDNYPAACRGIEDFIRQLENAPSMDPIRETMLKEYERLEKNYDGFYYIRYPDRKPGKMKQIWDSNQDGTFRRTGKKTGRNDPCPCGSGKKYKNCCGKNK